MTSRIPSLVHVLLSLAVVLPAFVELARAATVDGGIRLPTDPQSPRESPLQAGLLPVTAHATLLSVALAPPAPAPRSPRRRKAFVDLASGTFRFDDVEDGVHVLDVVASPLVFSSVAVTVAGGVVKEALASDVGNAPLPVDKEEGIWMVPLRVHSFFEQRGKFSLWAFVKTPYGAMICFALFSLVVMPYLKVDPEEYRQMKRELAQMTGGDAGDAGDAGAAGDAEKKEKNR